MTAPLTLGQEIDAPIVPSATGDQGKDAMIWRLMMST